MTNASEQLTAIETQRAIVERERAAAQQAELDRQTRENEQRKRLFMAEKELARLDAMHRRTAVELAVNDAKKERTDELAAIERMNAAAAPLIEAIAEWLDTAAAPAQVNYERTIRATDNALAAALDVYYAETPWHDEDTFEGQRAREQYNAGRMSVLGKTGEQLPAPLPIWAALAELAARETDDTRKRAVQALYAAFTGEYFTPGHDYDAQAAAQNTERQRRARFVRQPGR